jgi:magnesium chelatase subunit ChlI-like protein
VSTEISPLMQHIYSNKMSIANIAALWPPRSHACTVTGLTGDRTVVITTRPFRAPHHTISDAGLIGGGHVPMSGWGLLAPMACFSWMNCPSSAAAFTRYTVGFSDAARCALHAKFLLTEIRI